MFFYYHKPYFFVRLRGLAIFFLYDLLFMSLSGVLSRALGIVWDLRLFCTYDIYFLFCADFFFCCLGDAYDRFLLRFYDMRCSLLLIKQIFFVFFFGMNFFFEMYIFRYVNRNHNIYVL